MLAEHYIAFSQLGSYISVHVSLNLLNELGKSDIVFVCFFVIFFSQRRSNMSALVYLN